MLASVGDFTVENTEKATREWIEANGLSMGQIMNSLRLALVGAGKGPGMFDVCELLGKEETLARIDRALERLGK